MDNALICFNKAREVANKVSKEIRPNRAIRNKINRLSEKCSSNICRIYFVRGQYNEAVNECLQLLNSSAIDPIVNCATLYNLGLIHQVESEMSKAMQCYKNFLNHHSVTAERILSTEDVVTALLNILIVSNQESSEIHDLDLLRILKKTQILRDMLGYSHVSVANLLNDIGMKLVKHSSFNFALPFFFEQLKIEQLCFGYDHPVLAPTLYYIGKTFLGLNELTEAMEYFEQVLNLTNERKTYGKIYAFALYEIGVINYNHCSYSTATEQFIKAISELKIALGEYHADVAEMIENIGVINLEHGKLNEALNNILEAIMIQRIINGNYHHKVAQLLYQLGEIYELIGGDNEALNAYEQSLAIHNKSCVATEILAIKTLNKIGEISQSKGDNGKAVSAYEKIHDIVRLKYGEHHIVVLSLRKLIGCLCHENFITKKEIYLFKFSQFELQHLKQSPPEHIIDDEFEETILSLFGKYCDCGPLAAAAA